VASIVDVLAAAGADVTRIAPIVAFDTIADDHRVVMAYEAARNYAYEVDALGPALSAAFRALCELGRSIARADYRAAKSRIAAAARAFEAATRDFDAWIAPSALGEAPDAALGTGDPLMGRLWTAMGAPCLALPTGRGARGLPLGIQLVAAAGADDALIAAGRWCEERLRHRASFVPDP
jgi:Asp-tRNA(Asn)/Glu-tRNA(Gln) amidotransferase A subunit family amidase